MQANKMSSQPNLWCSFLHRFDWTGKSFCLAFTFRLVTHSAILIIPPRRRPPSKELTHLIALKLVLASAKWRCGSICVDAGETGVDTGVNDFYVCVSTYICSCMYQYLHEEFNQLSIPKLISNASHSHYECTTIKFLSFLFSLI